jgi:hypothetical protein
LRAKRGRLERRRGTTAQPPGQRSPPALARRHACRAGTRPDRAARRRGAARIAGGRAVFVLRLLSGGLQADRARTGRQRHPTRARGNALGVREAARGEGRGQRRAARSGKRSKQKGETPICSPSRRPKPPRRARRASPRQSRAGARRCNGRRGRREAAGWRRAASPKGHQPNSVAHSPRPAAPAAPEPPARCGGRVRHGTSAASEAGRRRGTAGEGGTHLERKKGCEKEEAAKRGSKKRGARGGRGTPPALGSLFGSQPRPAKYVQRFGKLDLTE